jgi:hypothetical protein
VTTSRSVAGKTTRKAGHRSADAERLTLLIAVLASVAAVGASILILNHGVCTYTFYDAYMHLVLARSLTIGHYGFNLSEFSSPASSILFPLLLVPFVRAGAGSAAPLLINTVALLATAYRQHRWMADDLQAARRLATMAILAMVLGFNLVTLVFTVRVAELRLSRRRITTGSDPVAFYVRDEPRAASTARALRVFARELPEDAALSVFCRHCFLKLL